MKKNFHKKNRLENYDYSSDGIYFLTVCTEQRKWLLSRIVARGIPDAPATELTSNGEAAKDAIAFLDKNWDCLSILKFVIMPNHIHLLVRVWGASGMPRATDAVIPKFVSALKRYTNRQCGQQLWQKSYYDHVIRDETDYLTKATYIENNAAKWAEDEYFVVGDCL
ncbi:MAG: hypothetical protein E7434_03720 [Ruminococcaceae bacterium]|nr:hypothetical protein [Oscillospiraceae bacterium]